MTHHPVLATLNAQFPAAQAAYYDAEFADALYSKTVRDVYGLTVTRGTWKLSENMEANREVLAAQRMKVDADTRFLATFGNKS
jgi:hypothetical protein